MVGATLPVWALALFAAALAPFAARALAVMLERRARDRTTRLLRDAAREPGTRAGASGDARASSLDEEPRV